MSAPRPKDCPLLSLAALIARTLMSESGRWSDDRLAAHGTSANRCVRERCAWWVAADAVVGPEYGCAIAIQAQTDSDGRIRS